jgi:hypothetical protein
MDTLRSVHRFSNLPGAQRSKQVIMKPKGELARIANELAQLMNVDVTTYTEGVGVLEGMILARNKIRPQRQSARRAG